MAKTRLRTGRDTSQTPLCAVSRGVTVAGMQKEDTIMKTGLTLAAAALCLTAGLASAEDRPWRLASDLTAAERAAVEDLMTELERECPSLANIDWANMPAPAADPAWLSTDLRPVYPDPESVWDRPAYAGWTVELPIVVDVVPGGPTVSVTLGGPENAGIVVLKEETGYAGAVNCEVVEANPHDDQARTLYRPVPALKDPLERLTN